VLLHEPKKRRLPRLPWPIDPARDLHAQPHAGGRVAGADVRLHTTPAPATAERASVAFGNALQ
jgi:hypothetical protein